MNRVHKITSRVVALCVVSLFFHGCAFTPDNWAFQKEFIDTEALTQVNRVALLDVPQPSYIWLGKPDSATAGFINPLISLAISTHEGDDITNSAYISKTTQNELKKWLEQAGKEVVLLDAKRANKSKMLKNYDQFTQVDADAILEVAPVNVGFMPEPGFGSKLSPSVFFTYRLVSRKNGEVLIESNVKYSSFYSYHGGVKGGILFGPEENIFEDEESLREQPEEAIRRLQVAIRGATEFIAGVVANKKPKTMIPIVKSSGEIDLTGTYISKVTISDSCFNFKKQFTTMLSQTDNILTGRMLLGVKGVIQGTVEDDKVNLFFTTAQCGNGQATWVVNSDGTGLEGYWGKRAGYSKTGEPSWSLLKVEN